MMNSICHVVDTHIYPKKSVHALLQRKVRIALSKLELGFAVHYPALLKSNDFSTKESACEIAIALPNQQRPLSIGVSSESGSSVEDAR
ncbi:hypothetical protein H6F50_12665 [Coleofasciculus sp. FACHB-712]|uniref:hypothetical protein n=1 Tax=Coleofasciculus sp. FACHB-712 TaxID=2692789 RepID=UPI001686005B|nr:hypothetical protein [Coleofasciculus sp. FACHB-712]MBD1943196.1 hypothetical protein [Coleofasciculus sp. FACHB-712]